MYDRDGGIVKASRYFRSVYDFTEEEIQQKKANLYDRLNEDREGTDESLWTNAGLLDAARNVFGKSPKHLLELERLFSAKTINAYTESAKYTEAIYGGSLKFRLVSD